MKTFHVAILSALILSTTSGKASAVVCLQNADRLQLVENSMSTLSVAKSFAEIQTKDSEATLLKLVAQQYIMTIGSSAFDTDDVFSLMQMASEESKKEAQVVLAQWMSKALLKISSSLKQLELIASGLGSDVSEHRSMRRAINSVIAETKTFILPMMHKLNSCVK